MRARFPLSVLLASLPLWSFSYGCKVSNESPRDTSEVAGIGDLFRAIPTPPVRSSEVLRNLVKKIAQVAVKAGTQSTSVEFLQSSFKSTLVDAIVQVGGLPRWQVTQILKELVGETSRICGGVSCSRVFGLEVNDLDNFLDKLHKEVQASSALKSSANVEKRRILLGSLQREEKLSTPSPTTKVSFVDTHIELLLQKRLGVDKRLTYGDLAKITDLEIDTWQMARARVLPKLDDLAKLPNLHRLKLSYHDGELPKQAAKFAKNIEHLELTRFSHLEHRIRVSLHLRAEDVDLFATNAGLKSLSVVSMRSEDIEALAKKFYHLTSFRVGFIDGFGDDFVENMRKMPNLRALIVEAGASSIRVSPNVTFPKSITSVEFNGLRSSCKDLAPLKVFSRVSNMTIKDCTIGALGAPNILLDWQFLSLKGCRPDGGVSKLFVKESLPKLRVFQSDNPSTLDLTDTSKQELVLRMAQDARE
jgi:hypothetical protein